MILLRTSLVLLLGAVGALQRGSCCSSREHIIGVRVSETTAEIRIVTASVMANSRNSRPTTSPMNSSGISTAISETVSEMMVKPICPAPFSAASNGALAVLDVARDVLDHDDGVVDDEAGGDGQRHQDEVVQAVAQQVHHRRRCRSATAARQARDERGRTLRRNRKITNTTSPTASTAPTPRRWTEARIAGGPVREHGDLEPAGSAVCSSGSCFLMGSTVSMTLAPGWRWTLTIDRRRLVHPAASCDVLGRSTTVATSVSRTAAPLR